MEKTCQRCGSQKVIPSVPLLDHYGRFGTPAMQAEVQVAGSPEAWFFTDATAGKIHARICGECGFTELWTSNFRELYEKYETATKGKS
jgi:predicted nucleic-acid-binding Zn-ribbon protein